MIYLDSAATTLEKPPSVANAVAHAITHLASPGRGGHPAAMEAGELLFRCRERAAQLFDVEQSDQVVLTVNATHGLNIAIHSLVKPNSTVLISGYEHNAVTRALHAIPNVKLKIAASELFDAESAYQRFRELLTEEVSVVICNHVSNVFGFIQPIGRIAQLCRMRGKPLIVDASQSAGMLPVSMKQWGAAFIAMPGHKGLYGPQGTGLLLCGSDVTPLLYGGTGSASIQQEMPEFLPDRLEAGTQNVCGAAGLLAGMEFVTKRGIERIGRHEQILCHYLADRLNKTPGIQVFSGEPQSGVLSFRIHGMDSELVGDLLGKRGIAVRAGLHCAPLAHKTVGTLDSGTVRVSFSAFNQIEHADRAAKIICRIATEGRAQS